LIDTGYVCERESLKPIFSEAGSATGFQLLRKSVNPEPPDFVEGSEATQSSALSGVYGVGFEAQADPLAERMAMRAMSLAMAPNT
jgi:hypothetical protein